jgi:hypothetical protein
MLFELSEADLVLIVKYLAKQSFEEVHHTILSLERQLQAHLANETPKGD